MTSVQASLGGKTYAVIGGGLAGCGQPEYDFLSEFRVVAFQSRQLPLVIAKPAKQDTGGDQALLEKRVDFIKACYSSLDSRQQIIEDFNARFPECSKKGLERLMKDMIIKEKREGDIRPSLYATQSSL